MKSFRVYGLTCVFLLATIAAHATTIVLPTDEQLIAKTPVILDGTVVSTAAIERDGAIWTDTTVDVARAIKGEVSGRITVHEMGGQLGDRITKLYGSPEFTAGERVLLFLEQAPHGGFRVVDLYVGKFSEGEMLSGRRLWLRNDASHDVNLLDADFQPLRAKNVQRDASAFETFVEERVAGRAGVKNYGVENPILARDLKTPRGIDSEFTLISDPNVYRWFAFASNQPARWYNVGSQPGYTDGGVAELQTALGSWSGYASAKILYTYAGVRTGTTGGLDTPNSVNEVLFNDPQNEISGTYNRNTGGVVGRGGFNGVSARQTWTATFAADANHPAGAQQAWNIIEGNLTIQDGVSPTNGISSKVLAEIVAHEFGHTLGFGHSSDGGALMYASVTGAGPALRADDQTAARWLYPGSGGTTPPPPPPPPSVPTAPNDLRATVLNNNIDLSWVDNSTNETGFSVYLAQGTGSFSRVVQVGTNITSTRLSGLASGSYRIYVVAYNGAGNSSASNTANATIAPAPVAAFTMTPQTGTEGVTTFTFYDGSTGSVSSRLWNFGDGATSTASVAKHIYAKAGTYTVKLTVTGVGQTSSTSKSFAVGSSVPVTPPVVAAFDVSTPTPAIGETVTFTDRSTGNPTRWTWSFGDGSTSTSRNPVHAYAGPGTYTVTLTAENNTSSAAASRQLTIAAIAPYRALVSVATYGGGVGGTSWRTELNLFNAGSQGANVSLVFLPAAGGSVATRTLFLSPRQLVTYDNALVDLFHIPSGAGALAIEATSAGTSAELRVSSRTFTPGSTGTYGQAVPDVQSDELEKTLYITGITANASYRTNIGVVNRGNAPMNATLTLLSRTGANLSAKTITVPANSFQQAPLAAFFPEVKEQSHDVLTMRIAAAASDFVSGYASVIDNATQDPLYVQARGAETGGALTLPVITRVPGANGTFWRSDVALFNPNSGGTTFTLRYAGATKSVFLGGNDTVLLADVLSQFGLSSGSGALQVTWTSASGPVVTSRTYTSVATGGTYGQSIDPVAEFASRVFVPGLRNDFNYRSNVGFVNGGTETESFDVILLSTAGTELGRNSITLGPGQQVQTSVKALFPNAFLSGGFTLQAEGDGNAKLFAYASMVDNASGDPVFFAGR